MPPKSSGKKSSATSWYHCEVCDVDITSKDRETHEKVCPIDSEANVQLEYIRNGCLYTSSIERRTFSVEGLEDVPAKYVNNLIFISEGAMRLAQFHIGQPVALSACKKSEAASPPLVRTIWPVPEKFLTTIFATEEDFKLNWIQYKGCGLKIEKLPNGNDVEPAKILRLQLQSTDTSEFNNAQIKDLERILKHELKNLIYTNGSAINIKFFNKTPKFVVTGWLAFHTKDEQTLEEAFDELNLNKSRDFFQVTIATRIEIEQAASASVTDNGEGCKYLCTKSDIGGLDEQVQLIEESMERALGLKATPTGVKVSRCILLYGSSGCGKSMICEAMSSAVQQRSHAYKVLVIKINTSELFSKFLGETEKNLSIHFDRAFANYPQPSLIIIEDVHTVCPKYQTNEVVKRVSAAFSNLLDSLNQRKEAQHVFVLATSSQIDSLNPSVRRCGRLDCEVEIGPPTPKGRSAILHSLLRKVEHCLTSSNIDEVANITHGFVGADLANIIYTASANVLKSNTTQPLSLQNILEALTHVKPSAMREVLIENPNVHWSDIGGQAELKLKFKQAIEWPLMHPEKFKKFGIKPPRGILMFGPPGCSKTMIAKALATESQLNFLSIKGPELFSMWVGESERAVREVFRKARQVAPSIVFFDEIDAIGGERGGGDGGSGSGSSVKERVLTQLLTELDGVETLQDVTIVAATNRPDMIDKALLRPGRIDRVIYVGLPDPEARREIFKIKLKKMPLAECVNIDELVCRTDGYSGAEIQAVCHEAALKTLEANFDAEKVTWPHFEYALTVVTPRTSPELLKLYEDYLKKS